MPTPKLYRISKLWPRELRTLEMSVGGKFSWRERLTKKGTGSPLFHYLDGLPELDRMQAGVSDELRINLEEFREGVFIRITDRTNPYIIPLRYDEIESVTFRSAERSGADPGGKIQRMRKGLFEKWAQMAAQNRSVIQCSILLRSGVSLRFWVPGQLSKKALSFFRQLPLGDQLQTIISDHS